MTNSALRPVSGWVVIAGCTCSASASSLVAMRIDRVWAVLASTPSAEYAQPALCTTFVRSSISRRPDDRVSKASSWLVHIVSPPCGGTSSDHSRVNDGGAGWKLQSLCQAPPKLNPDSLGLAHHPHHTGVVGDRLEERCVALAAELFGESLEVLDGVRLVAEEHHLVIEQRRAQRTQLAVGERSGQIDAADLGAERAGDAVDHEHGHDRSASVRRACSRANIAAFTR